MPRAAWSPFLVMSSATPACKHASWCDYRNVQRGSGRNWIAANFFEILHGWAAGPGYHLCCISCVLQTVLGKLDEAAENAVIAEADLRRIRLLSRGTKSQDQYDSKRSDDQKRTIIGPFARSGKRDEHPRVAMV